LGVIGGPENTYFQRCFDELKVPTNLRAAPELTPTAKSFQAIMAAAVETRRYEQKLAVLVGAEWSYLAWARPYVGRVESWPFIYGEWIALERVFFEESYVTA
jgi:thiaminase/transcriptional activator TenA